MAGSPRTPRPLARPYGGNRFRMTRIVLAAAHLDSDPTNNRLKNSALDRVGGRGERQDEGERRIEQGESAIAFVPARRAFVLGVDQQSDAADIIGDADAAFGRTQQESAAEPLALRRPINGEPAEAKHRHVVTAETLLRESGRAAVFERRGAQRVEAEDARRCVDRRGDEAFRAPAFVVLAGVALQMALSRRSGLAAYSVAG